MIVFILPSLCFIINQKPLPQRDELGVECKDFCPKSVQELMSTFGHPFLGDMDGESGYGNKIESCITFS